MRARWIDQQAEIEDIISSCDVSSLAMVDMENNPYVVPMNFGYKDGVIYFHGDNKGRKLDILRNNPSVAISFSTDHQLRYQNEEVACSYSMSYRSVFAYGKVEFIDDYQEKVKALNIIMANYSNLDFSYNAPSVNNVCVFIVRVTKFTAKEFGRRM
jgi:uncharacterized protein